MSSTGQTDVRSIDTSSDPYSSSANRPTVTAGNDAGKYVLVDR